MKNQDEDDGFVKGVAYAISMMNKDGCLTAEDLHQESGLTMKDFIKAGVDEHDMKQLRIMNDANCEENVGGKE